MYPTRKRQRRWLLLPVVLAVVLCRDAPARAHIGGCAGAETLLAAGVRELRFASWAAALEPIEVAGPQVGSTARIRLYDPAGDIDPEARAEFERIASHDPEPHRLAARVEQLVFKAAYHFDAPSMVVVSAWRRRAGRHGEGEAIDFKLKGVNPWKLGAYLRTLPRVGVGIYTNPATQFVHVDVRDPSYHWMDGSPPGVHWRERQLGDAKAKERDATYSPEMDLP